MKEVLVGANQKIHLHSFYHDSSANLQTTFNPPLYLEANRNYELAMVNLETYYSFANIRDGDNKSFKWSVDDSETWTILHVPTGCYELMDINAEIIRIRGNSDIKILQIINVAMRIDCGCSKVQS